MKKFFLISIGLIILNTAFSPVFSGYWTSLTSGVTNTLYGVCFIDESTGWVVGSGGLIRKTTDGGLSWTTQTSGITRSLYGVHFINSNTGFAVGDYITVLKTTNGGDSWSVVSYQPTYNYAVLSVALQSTSIARAVGERFSTYNFNNLYTTNGGTNFTASSNPSSTALRSIKCFIISRFTNDYIFLTCGNGGTIARISSGGTITDMSSGASNYYDVHYKLVNTIFSTYWAVGAGGVVKYKYNNDAWVSQSAGTGTLWSIDEADRLWIVGAGGSIYSSTNSGTNWNSYPNSPTTNTLYKLSFPSDYRGYAVGASGTIIAYINNKVTVTNVNASYCRDEAVTVTYTKHGLFESGNVFKAQLSDANGSFANPVEIGSVTSQSSGVITGRIPKTQAVGSNYRIRVISTAPAIIGDSTAAVFTINSLPSPTILGDSTNACANNLEPYTTSTGANISYLWTATGGTIQGAANQSNVNVLWGSAGTGKIKIVQTNTSTGCKDSLEKNVTIKPLPSPTITGDTITACANNAKPYSTSTGTNITYLWTVTGGTIQGLNNQSNVNVLWGTAGNGQIKIVQTNTLSGCKDSVLRNVIINPLPGSTIAGDSVTACANNPESYTTSTGSNKSYLWTATGGSIQGAANQSSVNILWGAAGNGKIKIVQTNTTTGCKDSLERKVIINPLPGSTITGDSVTACANNPESYTTSTGANISYLWAATGGTIQGAANQSNVNVLWGAAGNGKIKIVQTNTTTGCKDSLERNVIINPLPSPTIIGDSLTACANNPESYTTSTGSNISYLWTATGGTIQGAANQSTVNVLWGTAGNGKIKIVQTNNTSGCKDSLERNVIINPLPVPTIAGDSVTACANNPESYTTSTGSNISHLWTATGGTIQGAANQSTLNVLWGTAGNGKIKIVQTNTTTGCQDSLERNVIINPLPVPTIVGDSITACANNPESYTTSTGSNISYLWTATGGTIQGAANQSTVNVLWGTAGNGKIKIVQTNTLTSCKDSLERNIIINPLPVPTISGDTLTVCGNNLNTYSTSAGSNLSYLWTATGGIIQGSSTQNSVNVLWGAAGTGKIKIVQKNSLTSCSDSLERNVIINPLPTPTIVGDTLSVCANNTNPYYTSTGSNLLYLWTVTGGTILGATNQGNVNVIWDVAGTGKIKIVLTNTNTGCKDSLERKVIINPLPVPTFTGEENVCARDSKSYTAETGSGYKYFWTATDGTIQGSPTSNPVTVIWSDKSSGKLKLIIQNNSSCRDSLEKNIIINPLPLIPVVSDTNIEQGTTATLIITGPSNCTFKWYNTQTGGATFHTGQSYTTPTLNEEKTYYIDAIDNTTKCKSATRKAVTVTVRDPISLPVILISNNETICEGDSVKIGIKQAMSGGTGPYKYQWTPKSDLKNDKDSVTLAYPKGLTQYTLTVTDNIGRTGSAKVTITVNPLPMLAEISDTTIEKGTEVMLMVRGPSNATFYWYDNQNEGSLLYSGSNYHTPALYDNTSYWIETEDIYTGCRTKARKEVKVFVTAPNDLNPHLKDRLLSICEGDTVEIGLNNDPLNGTPPYTYQWDPATDILSKSDSVTLAYPKTTTKYTLTVQDKIGRKGSDNVVITVNQHPALAVISDKTVVSGQSATLIVNGPPNCAFNWYYDSTGMSPFYTGPSYTTPALNKEVKYYIESIDSVSGCKSIGRKAVTVFIAPPGVMIINTIDPVPICEGDSVLIGIASIENAEWPYKFEWTPQSGLSSYTDSLVKASPSSSTDYQIKITDNKDKDTAIIVKVIVNPTPAIPQINDTIVNPDTEASLTILGPDNCTFYWYNVSSGGTSFFSGQSYTTPKLNAEVRYYIESEDNITKCRSKERKEVKVTINQQPGVCLSTKDLTLPDVYFGSDYNSTERATVVFNNTCNFKITITDLNFENPSGQFKIIRTIPDLPAIIQPGRDFNVIVEFKPTKEGIDSANLEALTDNQEKRKVTIYAKGVNSDNSPVTWIKLVAVPESESPGKSVQIELRLTNRKNVSLSSQDRYQTKFWLNGEPLAFTGVNSKYKDLISRPIITLPDIEKDLHDVSVEFNGNFNNDDVLASFDFMATLGEIDSTNLIIEYFKWNGQNIIANVINESKFYLNVCQVDGKRLLKKGAGPLLDLSVMPIPANERLIINYIVEENTDLKIRIFDSYGQQMDFFYENYRNKGKQSKIINTENYLSGLYNVVIEYNGYLYYKNILIVK